MSKKKKLSQFFDEALEKAKEIDSSSPENRRKLPLCGIPVSIKDEYWVKGQLTLHLLNKKAVFAFTGSDSTCGLIAKCFKPATEDAVLVEILRKMGAIVIVKGNMGFFFCQKCEFIATTEGSPTLTNFMGSYIFLILSLPRKSKCVFFG